MANNYFNFTQPVVAGTRIVSARYNQDLSAIAAAFDVLPGSDDLFLSLIGYGPATGSVPNVYNVTIPVGAPLVGYVTGMQITFLADKTSTGAAQVNVNGLGNKLIVSSGTVGLPAGSIIAGSYYTMRYDGVNFQMQTALYALFDQGVANAVAAAAAAAISASNALSSANASAGSASAASGSASSATGSASAAAGSASAAATSASQALGYRNDAQTAATNAANSASAAAGSATAAATSATNAANSATAAATSATNAANSATDAANSATAAANSAATIDVSNLLRKSNNLSDVTNAATSRTNISAAKLGVNSDITSLTGLTTALSIAQGGTGNTTGLAASATVLATSRTFITNLASTTATGFDGSANNSHGVTGTLGYANGGTNATTAAAAWANLAVYGTTAGTAAQGNDARLNTIDGKSGGTITGTFSTLTGRFDSGFPTDFAFRKLPEGAVSSGGTVRNLYGAAFLNLTQRWEMDCFNSGTDIQARIAVFNGGDSNAFYAGVTRCGDSKNGAFAYSGSDQILKHDIVDSDRANALSRIKQLRSRQFTWNNDNRIDRGWIAQELQVIDPRYAYYPSGTNIMGVSDRAIVADLVDVVISLEEKIAQLTTNMEKG